MFNEEDVLDLLSDAFKDIRDSFDSEDSKLLLNKIEFMVTVACIKVIVNRRININKEVN